MTVCAFPGCDRTADKDYRCAECGDYFCAMHIYQSGGYICKTHFEAYVEPGIDSLKASASPFRNQRIGLTLKSRFVYLGFAVVVAILVLVFLSSKA